MGAYLNAQISPFFLSTEIASFAAGSSASLTPLNPEISSELGVDPSIAVKDSFAAKASPDVKLSTLIDGGKLFAAGEGSSDVAGGTPPPSGNAPSGGGGRRDGGVGFSMLPTLNVVEHDRLYNMKQMGSVEALENSIIMDLATIEAGGGDQLGYLNDVAKTFDEFVRSGSSMSFGEMVDATSFISQAADGLSGFITPKTVEDNPGVEPTIVLMGRLTATADHLEHLLLVSRTMDPGTAFKLATIYLVSTMKSFNAQALMIRFSKGVNHPAYRVHAGKTILQLIDVKERFERLGKVKEAGEAMRLLTVATVQHGFTPNSQTRALDAVVNFIGHGIEFIYDPIEVDSSLTTRMREKQRRDAKAERESRFLHNLRYLIDGNRRFTPSILSRCKSKFFEMGDKRKM